MYLSFVRLIFFIGIPLLFSFAEAEGQVKFYATISPQTINVTEYASLTLVAENADEISNVSIPNLGTLKLMGGESRGQGITVVNGVSSQKVYITYTLSAMKAGKFTIPPVRAMVDGTWMVTQPVTLNVTTTMGGPGGISGRQLPGFINDPFAGPAMSSLAEETVLKPGENVAEKINKNMQLRLETDKTSLYVGEPLTAAYKLYTRFETESSLSKNPAFNGFSVIDIPGSMDPETGTYLGKPCDVYTIRKAQLYPLQAGEYQLETATLENTISFIAKDAHPDPNDIFASLGKQVQQKISISSKPLNITVKPLPENGKPVSFSGAVGDFKLQSNLRTPEITTVGSGSLDIMIAGRGNMQMLTAPVIKWPDGVDGFDPQMSDNTNQMIVPVEGSKTFTYSFNTGKTGTLTIPAVEFSFFNPATATYKTLTTGPFTVHVRQGNGENKKVLAADEKNAAWKNLLSNKTLWLSLGGILLLTLIFSALKRSGKNKKTEQKTETPEPAPNNKVEEQEALPENWKDYLGNSEEKIFHGTDAEFLGTLNQDLKQFLSKKTGLHPIDINARTVTSALDKIGIGNGLAIDLQKLLADIEFNLYAPAGSASINKNDLYSRAKTIVTAVCDLKKV